MEWCGRELVVKRELYGYEIRAQITMLPQDICILLMGGELPHIGSINIYENGNSVDRILLEGHKDHYIGAYWAKVISREKTCRVTVICGIHYDNATQDMIQNIQKQADIMLEEVLFAL